MMSDNDFQDFERQLAENRSGMFDLCNVKTYQ